MLDVSCLADIEEGPLLVLEEVDPGIGRKMFDFLIQGVHICSNYSRLGVKSNLVKREIVRGEVFALHFLRIFSKPSKSADVPGTSRIMIYSLSPRTVVYFFSKKSYTDLQ